MYKITIFKTEAWDWALIKENEEKKFDKHILKSGACDLACTAVLGCSPVQDSSQAPSLVRGGKKIQKNIIWGSLARERWKKTVVNKYHMVLPYSREVGKTFAICFGGRVPCL